MSKQGSLRKSIHAITLTAGVCSAIGTKAVAAAQEESGAPPASTATALSRVQSSRGSGFNPDIGVNALMLYQNSNRGNDPTSDPRNGFSVQEAELQFSADVDPNWRFSALFSVHPELDTTVAPPYPTEYVFEPEEVFAETLSLPLATLRAGKFKAAFGRHNLLHTHAFAFIDAPLIQTALLGEEGFNDVGASAAVLVPAPWFSEIAFQVLSGRSEGLNHFSSSSPNSIVPLVHFKNLVELNEESTIQLGLSAASGKNATDENTELFGVDLTFKWRPVLFGTSRSLVWSTEVIQRALNRPGMKEEGRGFVSYAQLQLASRWWLQGRGEYLEIKDDNPGNTITSFARKESALVAYVPSEFSSLRLQFDRLRDSQHEAEHKVSLQLNFSIGAHPAHLY